MLVRKPSLIFKKLIPGLAFLFPVIFLGIFEKPSFSEQKDPANKDDVFLYRGIGGTFICNSLSAGIEFPKAAGIASATYVQVLEGKHGGVVTDVSSEKLPRETLFRGAEFQVVTAAIQFCPDRVPEEVKKKVAKALEETSEKNKSTKKKKKKKKR